MNKGLKIGLIIGGTLSLIGAGFGIYKLIKKDESSTDSEDSSSTGLIGSSNSGTDTLKNTTTATGYTFLDVAKNGDVNPIKGETLYALQDGAIAFRNYADSDKKNYKEWETTYSKGDAIGVVQDYTSNCIFTSGSHTMALKKNAVCVKRGTINAGKIGVLRDKYGSATNLQDVKSSGLSLSTIIDLYNAGQSIYSTYQNSSLNTKKDTTTTDNSSTTTETKSSADGTKIVLNKIVK